MVYEDDPEPARYYDWMLWKLRKSEKWKEAVKYSKDRKKEEHIKKQSAYANPIQIDAFEKDIQELTKEKYTLYGKVQKLVDELNECQKGMNCWHCNTKLIWGADHDLEDDSCEEYDMVTNLSCPQCEAFVEVYNKRT